MRIVTLTCSDCGTIVAANELEERRVMKCPGLDCEAVLRFDDLPRGERDHIVEHRERFRMD